MRSGSTSARAAAAAIRSLEVRAKNASFGSAQPIKLGILKRKPGPAPGKRGVKPGLLKKKKKRGRKPKPKFDSDEEDFSPAFIKTPKKRKYAAVDGEGAAAAAGGADAAEDGLNGGGEDDGEDVGIRRPKRAAAPKNFESYNVSKYSVRRLNRSRISRIFAYN